MKSLKSIKWKLAITQSIKKHNYNTTHKQNTIYTQLETHTKKENTTLHKCKVNTKHMHTNNHMLALIE